MVNKWLRSINRGISNVSDGDAPYRGARHFFDSEADKREMPNRHPLTTLNLGWLRLSLGSERPWLAVALLILGPNAAHAAQSGEIASASRGAVLISATVGAQVSVAPISGEIFLTTDPSGLSATVGHICVQSNSGTGYIDLIATGETNGTNFILSSSNGRAVPLALSWTDRLGSTRSLTPGQPLRTVPERPAACELGGGSTLSMVAPVTEAVSTGAITLTLAPL